MTTTRAANEWTAEQLERTGPSGYLRLASLIASGALAEYRAMLGAALNIGATAAEVKEVVYQAVAYVGMGRVFDFRGVQGAVPGGTFM